MFSLKISEYSLIIYRFFYRLNPTFLLIHFKRAHTHTHDSFPRRWKRSGDGGSWLRAVKTRTRRNSRSRIRDSFVRIAYKLRTSTRTLALFRRGEKERAPRWRHEPQTRGMRRRPRRGRRGRWSRFDRINLAYSAAWRGVTASNDIF